MGTSRATGTGRGLLEQARATARLLKYAGFGFNAGEIDYNKLLLSRISQDELTQLVAIAIWRSEISEEGFYTLLRNEIARAGYYKNRKGVKSDFVVANYQNDRQVRQLYSLYSAVGFQLFYELLAPDIPRSTFQKWTWRAFGGRKDEARPQRSHTSLIKKWIKEGCFVRFSNTSSSIYIVHNEGRIRISDHRTAWDEDCLLNIIIKE